MKIGLRIIKQSKSGKQGRGTEYSFRQDDEESVQKCETGDTTERIYIPNTSGKKNPDRGNSQTTQSRERNTLGAFKAGIPLTG